LSRLGPCPYIGKHLCAPWTSPGPLRTFFMPPRPCFLVLWVLPSAKHVVLCLSQRGPSSTITSPLVPLLHRIPVAFSLVGRTGYSSLSLTACASLLHCTLRCEGLSYSCAALVTTVPNSGLGAALAVCLLANLAVTSAAFCASLLGAHPGPTFLSTRSPAVLGKTRSFSVGPRLGLPEIFSWTYSPAGACVVHHAIGSVGYPSAWKSSSTTHASRTPPCSPSLTSY